MRGWFYRVAGSFAAIALLSVAAHTAVANGELASPPSSGAIEFVIGQRAADAYESRSSYWNAYVAYYNEAVYYLGYEATYGDLAWAYAYNSYAMAMYNYKLWEYNDVYLAMSWYEYYMAYAYWHYYTYYGYGCLANYYWNYSMAYSWYYYALYGYYWYVAYGDYTSAWEWYEYYMSDARYYWNQL